VGLGIVSQIGSVKRAKTKNGDYYIMNITTKLVMNGSKIDSAASTAAFETELAKLVTEHETEVSTLGAAVQAVLAAHPGKGIAMPVLASLALNSINVQPESYTSLEAAALQYVRDNAQGEDSLFAIVRGPKGGVFLRAEMPVKATK
jgi:hypothetical protein